MFDNINLVLYYLIIARMKSYSFTQTVQHKKVISFDVIIVFIRGLRLFNVKKEKTSKVLFKPKN